MKQQLINTLPDKTEITGIVGLGCVEIFLALRYVEAGYKVLRLDIAPVKIDKISSGSKTILN